MIDPPWVREPEKWTCPECDSHNLSASDAVIWTCLDCGCRKSWEAFARSSRQRLGRVSDGASCQRPIAEGECEGSLADYLGWTWAEYATYVETNTLPPERDGAL